MRCTVGLGVVANCHGTTRCLGGAIAFVTKSFSVVCKHVDLSRNVDILSVLDLGDVVNGNVFLFASAVMGDAEVASQCLDGGPLRGESAGSERVLGATGAGMLWALERPHVMTGASDAAVCV